MYPGRNWPSHGGLLTTRGISNNHQSAVLWRGRHFAYRSSGLQKVSTFQLYTWGDSLAEKSSCLESQRIGVPRPCLFHQTRLTSCCEGHWPAPGRSQSLAFTITPSIQYDYTHLIDAEGDFRSVKWTVQVTDLIGGAPRVPRRVLQSWLSLHRWKKVHLLRTAI